MEVNQPQGTFNTDLKLIKTLSAHKDPKQWAKPQNLQQLTALLRYKNKTDDPQHPQQLQRGREWLSKKGVNLEPLLERIAFIQKQPKQERERAVSDNYFHVDLSEKSIPEYLEKAQEYSTMNLMQKIMSGGNFRKKFTAKYLQQQLSSGPNKFSTWQSENQGQKRKVYIELVKRVVQLKSERQNVVHQLLKQLRSAVGQLEDDSIWQILSFQLEAYQKNAPAAVNFTRMFITSIKLIQQEFQKRLHGQDLQRYLAKNYIAKAQGRWPFEIGGFWAKVWLYYCLGLQQEVIDLLSSNVRDYKDLAQLYIASEQALNSGRPIKQQFISRYEIDDIFYDQFIFNITGQSRYSCDMMAEQKCLQLILIVIRTIGVFYATDSQKFEQVRSGLLRKYRDFTSDPRIMRYMLYLLSYDQIVKMGPNSLMSSDDYLHFLIILSGYQGIVDQSKLEPILTQELSQFISQLIVEGRPQYIYYISLIPEHCLLNEVSSIILSSDFIDKFNWKAVKNIIHQQLYNSLVYSTIEKYRLREKADLKAAQKINQLANDREKAFSYLINLIVSHYLSLCKYPKEDVQRAEELGFGWSRQIGVSKVYGHLFSFFSSIRVLNSLLVKRNQQSLKAFISNSEFVALDMDNLNSLNFRMLELLSQEKGINLYLYYLRLIVKGSEIYASRMGEGDRLEKIKRMIGRQLKEIQNASNLNLDVNSIQFTLLKEECSLELL